MTDSAAAENLANASFPEASSAEPDESSRSMLDVLGRETGIDPLQLPLVFRFTWQNIIFDAEVAGANDGGEAVMTIFAQLGSLPFTAENTFIRKTMIDRFRISPFERGGNVHLTRQSTVELQLKTRLPRQAGPEDALHAATVCLIQVKDDLNAIRSTLGAA